MSADDRSHSETVSKSSGTSTHPASKPSLPRRRSASKPSAEEKRARLEAQDLNNLKLVKRLVGAATRIMRTPVKQIHALSSLNISSDCSKEARATLAKMLGRVAAESPLAPPPGVGFLRSNTTVYAFLLDDVAGRSVATSATPVRDQTPAVSTPDPSPASSPTEFAPAFREAFARLNQRNGGTNFVRLIELRQALPQFDRATFDSELQELRRGWEFSLEAHEGLHVQISPEERASGIPEMGTLLIYVSRR